LLAVSGKGGTGKSTLTALIARSLIQRRSRRLLLVDADPSLNLTLMLGLDTERSLGALREALHASGELAEQAASGDQHVREIVIERCLQDAGELSMLTMGRPEGPGCFCAVNTLLRYGVESLAKRFESTIIDCEAGPEQVNRKVTKSIDAMILTVEPTLRSVQTAAYIKTVAERYGVDGPVQVHVVLNKAVGQESTARVRRSLSDHGLELFAQVPRDEAIAEHDALGLSVLDIPADAPSAVAVDELVTRLGL
jgi:CO dehydrogenase maturation factor